MKKHYLLTPGPTPIPPEVAQKESLPILHHRTSEFSQIFMRNEGSILEAWLGLMEAYLQMAWELMTQERSRLMAKY